MEPKLLLLDEPLSNLDAKLRERMRFELKRLQRELRVTTVYVTHDQSEALALSHEIGVMNEGRLDAGRLAPRDLRASRQSVRRRFRRHDELHPRVPSRRRPATGSVASTARSAVSRRWRPSRCASATRSC